MHSNDICKQITFRHPGTMMSPEMTFSLSKDSNNDDMRKKALEKLRKDTPLAYKPQALATVDIGYGGSGTGHKQITQDGAYVYQAALLHWATNDNAFAFKAIEVIKSWSTVNKVFKGDNAPLEAGWGVCSMARAAELLKYSTSKEVVKSWQEVEITFYRWLDTIIMPVLNKADLWRWNIIGNWHFTILCAKAQIAILRNDVQLFHDVVNKYKEVLPRAICNGNDWCISETRRDLTHAQFLLGGIIQLPEMAFHQGITDLFDPKLAKTFENHARLMMKELPEGISKTDIHTPYGYWHEPVWELALAHFRDRLGMNMYNTEKWVQTFRPESVTFHWGGCTLTHYKRCKPAK